MNASELRGLGRRVADEQERALDAWHPDESARRAVAEHAALHGVRRSGRRIAVVGWLGAALVVSCAAAVLLLRGGDERLTFRVSDRPGSVSPDWVTAESADVPIRFSDGTSVVLRPGARARVADVSEHGAIVVLESGAAAVSIVPDGKGRWEIRSGPFEVRVHGTRFDIAWDPARDQFRLSLYAGKVVLAGCVFGNGQAVAAGQEVTASCSRRELGVKPIGTTRATALGGEATRTSSANVKTEATEAPDVPAEGARSATVAPPRSRETERAPLGDEPGAIAPAVPVGDQVWRSLAADGRYREAYAAAQRIGFEALQRRSPAGDLLLLGDSARHAGSPSEAVAAYETARRRFPGTEPAAVAAFSLGRLAFDASEEPAARRWLNVYLTERPGGALAEAALGRLFELARRGDAGEGRAMAERYLRQYPNGPRAAEAASVLDSAKAEVSQ